MIRKHSFSDATIQSLLAELEEKDRFVVLETTRVNQEDHLSYIFKDPHASLVCRIGDDPSEFLAKAEEWLQRRYYLAGWLGYEFGYLLESTLHACCQTVPNTATADLLAELFVFEKPTVFNHLSGSVSDGRPWPQKNDGGSLHRADACSLVNLKLSMEQDEYLAAFKRIKSYIANGDTYQVNYTLKYTFDFSGSAAALYASLRRNQSVSYGAFIKSGSRRILSFSPELFFRKKGNTIAVRPMKGTLQRGRTNEEDNILIQGLKDDIKTRSENVMIVDLLRNDLGRLNRLRTVGGVIVHSLFDVETYETLHQMTSTVHGNLVEEEAGEVTVAELIKALFPCGSVTGAPKIRTMEIIHELERDRRGVYTGAIGFFSPEKEAVFSVPIRTVLLNGKNGEMGIGSGIVSDSDGEKEWDECKLKAHFLTSSLPHFQLFETMLWLPRDGYWLLDLHMRRLEESARYFTFSFDREELDGRMAMEVTGFSQVPHRVRLTLAKEGTIQIHSTALAADDMLVKEISLGVLPGNRDEETGSAPPKKVFFSDQYTDSTNPHFYHKTTMRSLYDNERARAIKEGYFEVLFCNEKGEVTEGSITNIFIRKGNTLLTPPVTSGLLPGIFRRYFLDTYPGQVQEEILTQEDVRKADAVYVANSVRGLVRVQLV